LIEFVIFTSWRHTLNSATLGHSILNIPFQSEQKTPLLLGSGRVLGGLGRVGFTFLGALLSALLDSVQGVNECVLLGLQCDMWFDASIGGWSAWPDV